MVVGPPHPHRDRSPAAPRLVSALETSCSSFLYSAKLFTPIAVTLDMISALLVPIPSCSLQIDSKVTK